MAISLGGFSGGGAGAVTSVNGQTGVVVVSGDDVAADHTASNYTAANANVDGHLSGIDTKLGTLAAGLTYKGAFNATAGTPSIANALQGDLYVIDTAGTIYGQTWAIGDHLLINANMGGVIDNAKIDKVDNTDQVTSVNGSTGAVTLSGDDLTADHTASNYTAANANIDGHLSGIDSKFGTLGTASTAATTDFLQVTNNLSDVTAATARTNLGLGTAATAASADFLQVSNNLSDVTAATARTNLGLGTAATAASADFLSGTGADTLGGNLDVGTSDIVSSSNNNIEFAADGTGVVKVIPTATGGHLELNGDGTNVGKLRLMCEQSSHGIYLTGPSHSASASYTLKFPDTAGTNNYVLKTDGSGNLDWVAQSGGGSAPSVTTDSSGTDTTISTSTGIEEVHLIDNGASAVVITLPAVATAGTGYKYNIKRLGTGTVTIDANSSETIDGATTFAIGAQNDSITLVAVVQSGTDTWFLI